MLSNLPNLTDNRENIKVIVRQRPKLEREYDPCNFMQIEDNAIFVQNNKETKQFSYDHIATEKSSQYEVFENTAKPMIDSLLMGYNGTIFVYGQTGSGKTYTLLGNNYSVSNYCPDFSKLSIPTNELENKGILPLSIEYLFNQIKEQADNIITKISCSFLEIYKESLFDLLDSFTVNKQLQIRESFNKSMIVDGLLKVPMTSLEEALDLVKKGSRNRHVGSTNMNTESSRSHAVFSIYLENKSNTLENKVKTKKSVFHLIDLAGSERQSATDAAGERLSEAQKINKSLMNLGIVIRGLVESTEGKKNFIHYRDSQLTYLLKDSLGGNSKTCIIANISPANACIQETLSTLSFAQNAKLIKNKAIINEEVSNDYLYKEEFRKLKEKYNTIEKERNYLQKLVMSQRNGGIDIMNKLSSDNLGLNIRSFEEEIETIMGLVVEKEEQIKFYSNENDELKEKISTKEAELKIKEKELYEIKDLYQQYKREQDEKLGNFNQFVLKNVYLEQNVSNLEVTLKNKEFKLKKEIEELQRSIDDNKRIIGSKEKTIDTLNQEINSYMQIINQKDSKIQDLKNEIKIKEDEINGLIHEKEKQKSLNDEKTSELILIKTNMDDINSKLKIKDNELSDVRKQGRNLFNNFEKQVEIYKNKIKEFEQTLNNAKEENKNLNNIIDENKSERNNLETQYFESNEKVVNLFKQIADLNDKIKMLEEDKKNSSLAINKLTADLDAMLVPNNTNNSNKIIYYKKIKDENNKLKEENNELKLKFEMLEKAVKKINTKTGTTDLLIELEKKNTDLNKLRGIIYKFNFDIKEYINNFLVSTEAQDNKELNNFIESKSMDEKFKYYIDKLTTAIECKEKQMESLTAKLEVKENQIAKLEREIYYRMNKEILTVLKSLPKDNSDMTLEKNFLSESKIFNSVMKNEITMSTRKKRKFEVCNEDKENSSKIGNKMQLENGITSSNYKIFKTTSIKPNTEIKQKHNKII